MDLRTALKKQYHSGLAMLRQCVEVCPDDMWTAGTHPRTFWRIAFHAAFFTQLYLGQDEAAFQKWPGCKEAAYPELWERPADVEPYELPEDAKSYTRPQLLAYLAFVDEQIDSLVDTLDLDTDESGFSWYTSTPKLSHVLMTLRHLQGHVGQLSELLMARDIDIDWVS